MKAYIKRMIDQLLPQSIKNDYITRGKKLAFVGNAFYCPCCEQTFRVFLPYGLKIRLNALCPGCSSLERHRLIWSFLQHRTNLFTSGGKLFHVAPEKIFFRKFSVLPNIDYFPCAKFGDGFPDEYSKGTHNVDITSIEFKNNSFDFILCNHVLEHVPEDRQAMKELYRILKPGGWAILQVPLDQTRSVTFEDFSITDPSERERLFGQNDHVRVYGRDYKDRLLDAGFIVSVDDYAKQLLPSEAFRMGIVPEHDIFFCSKNS